MYNNKYVYLVVRTIVDDNDFYTSVCYSSLNYDKAVSVYRDLLKIYPDQLQFCKSMLRE